MSNQTLQLYEYHVWANRLVFEHLRKLPEDVWNNDVTSVFSSVSSLMSHVHAMDAMWLSVMHESPFDEVRVLLMRLIEESKTESLDGMQKRFAETADDYREFLAVCNPERIISIAHPKFGSANTAISHLVQHVVNHGTYHRGNLTAMLRQSGHSGVPTDYAFYLYTV